MKTTNLTRVALMLTLLMISSQFSIPIGPVAMSLQTLIVLIIGLILPTAQAVLTTSLYLVIGLIGLPIFTQAMGGLHSVFLPSFGFILSFIPAVWGMSKVREMYSKDGIYSYVIAVLLGNLIIYVIGLSYMLFIFVLYLGKEMSFWQIMTVGMLPFIPGDVIKSVVAISISKQLNSYRNFRDI